MRLALPLPWLRPAQAWVRSSWPWVLLGGVLTLAVLLAGGWMTWTAAPEAAREQAMAPDAATAIAAADPASASGALWGYLDGQGRPQFADHQVDARYERLDGGPSGVDPVSGKRDHPRSLALALEISPKALALRNWVRQSASEHGVDAELLMAVIATESGFEPGLVSPRGAVGLMQIMPEAAQDHARAQERDIDWRQRLKDPRWNIDMGARILARLQQRFGRVDLVVAAWNAGAGKVRRAGGVPQIQETQAHVLMVLELYWAQLQRGDRPALARSAR